MKLLNNFPSLKGKSTYSTMSLSNSTKFSSKFHLQELFEYMDNEYPLSDFAELLEKETGGKFTQLTLRETIQMYKMKTSALLRAALVAGAIRFEASEYVIKSFEDYADNFGLLFQVVDDILDKTSTKEVLGKDVKKDAENNKATYVDLVGGIENAKVNCQMFAQRAINAIKLV